MASQSSPVVLKQLKLNLSAITIGKKQVPDLLDILNEEPLRSKSKLLTSTKPSSDILSLIDPVSPKDSPSSDKEHTPLSQATPSSSKPSRTLFPITPNSSTRKRSLSDSNKPQVKRRKKDASQVYQLDFGQKLLGHVTCRVCGMVYAPDMMSDSSDHSRFHANFLSTVNFPGWKVERVVSVLVQGRIIMVTPSDAKLHRKKMTEIENLVNEELGYNPASNNQREFTVFLFISLKKKVVGCAYVERINHGYEVLTNEEGTDNLSAWFCSTVARPAVLGIHRLWVSMHARRTGVATKLLDAARMAFFTGEVVPKDKIGFTDPTPDGRLFATKYTGRSNFLAYRYST